MMYSENNTIAMEKSFNCCVLSSDTSKITSFPLPILSDNNVKFVNINDKKIFLDKLTVGYLNEFMCPKLDVSAMRAMKLWKINVKKSVIKDEVSTENDIIQKLNGKEMEPEELFKEYFRTELDELDKQTDATNIHIFTIITSTAGPSQQGVPLGTVDWNNVDSIYNWIKSLKRPPETVAPKLVDSYGVKFPLQGRDETTKILFEGNVSKKGLCERFEKRKSTDRNLHPILLLANGPGTGKSRFLQELPTLLREQAEKYTNNNELLKMINNRMYAINVTFGNGTSASDGDVPIGETSVALRILYEHFISGTIKYEEFLRMYRGKKLKIADALDIVLKDVNSDKNKDSHIKFVVLGIDELNALHDLFDRDLDHKLGPVHLIMRAVGGLNCSGGDIFYVSILAGTIQGPFEELFIKSTYLYLYLPLRLLQDKEVWKISESVADSERNSNLGDYINRSTFRRCISDFGGQVRALDLFYDELLKQITLKTGKVNYVGIITDIKGQLEARYPFKEFATSITPVITHAILNIPVKKNEKVGNSTYVDLKSRGILNLESAPNNLFYVRIPYMWVWILTSYNQSCESWNVMIDQKLHVLWEDFEDFNMRFWALRLRLLSTLNRNVTIQDIFRGAFYLDEFGFLDHKKRKFNLPNTSSIKYQELKHQYPQTVQQEHLAPGTIYKNCEGAESWDVFFFLNNFLFAIQVKSSKAPANQPQALNKRMISEEYRKTEKAFKLLKEQVPDIKDWMLFICTNGCKTEDALDQLPENCLAVCNENFKDFYGYTFSSRAEFCAASDQLDANSAEDFELCTIKNIGPSTACKIHEKRPYDNEDNLYDKVEINEQAKKRLKVIKNIN